MAKITLITGGARSGKSTRALQLAAEYAGKKAFVATAIAFDDEMADRIAKHQAERGDDFITFEEPVEISKVADKLTEDIEVTLVDCLTVWMGNLMHEFGFEDDNYPPKERFLEQIRNWPTDLILVTNEVGMGIVPEHKMARVFRDFAGKLNQQVAAIADEVILMTSGIALKIKE